MNKANAIQTVRRAAKNAGLSDVYQDSFIEQVIVSACAEFTARTRYLMTGSDVALVAGQAQITLAAACRPDMLISAMVTSPATMIGRLTIVSIDGLLEEAALTPQTANPTKLAIETFYPPAAAVARLYPTPSANGTLRIRYGLPMVAWVDDRLPDDVLLPILEYGATSRLKAGSPEDRAFILDCSQRFAAHIARHTGVAHGVERYQMKRGR